MVVGNLINPKFNLVDPVLQAAAFRFLCESWMMRELLEEEIQNIPENIIFQRYGPSNTSPLDPWAKSVRRLISESLGTNNTVLDKFPDLAFYLAVTIRVGTLTDLWLQTIRKWETNGEYGENKTVTEAHRNMLSKIAKACEECELFVEAKVVGTVEELDLDMNALHGLETVRVGFLDLGMER